MSAEPVPVWDAIETASADGVEGLEWIASPARPRPVDVNTAGESRRTAELAAERAVLGAILIDGAAIADALDHIKADDFTTPEHRQIFGAMLRCFGRGERPDVVAVSVDLAGDCDAAYLARLAVETPTSVEAGGYAALVATAARRRRISEAAGRIAEAAVYGAGEDEIARRLAELETVASRRAGTRADRQVGSRTAADLRCGMPPDQLADPFLTAEGPTVIYARGGTGKGLMACLLIKRIVAAGYLVMVVDYEGHEREWGSRLRGLGLTEDELAHVHYRAPFAPDWTAPTGSLATSADAIREDAERLGVTYLVVDSYSVATSNGDTMGGEQAAREYFGALARIGLPSLTIAHVRGDSGRFPERPFGSVFVHNLARETWAVERVGDGEPESDPDLIQIGPHVVALELRNKKSNARPICPAQFVTFSFFGDGTIEVATGGPADRSVADLAADVLAEKPLPLAKIAAAIKEDTGRAVSGDALSVTLKRYPRRFQQSTSGRPRTWSVR
jgi:hypothetical protein